MKKALLLVFAITGILRVVAQQGVAVGNSTIHHSAILDLSRSTRGVLVPRLTQPARLGISKPAEGLIVYDSTFNRFYQYQENNWRHILINTYWTKPTTGRYISTFDSVGIGTTSPDARLEVNGNIRCRDFIYATSVSAGNTLQGDLLTASGNIISQGATFATGDFIANGDVIIDNTNPIVQIKSSNQNKVFIQASADDLRLGTNSGNTTGKTIIRMNGSDIISIDTMSGLKVLVGGSGGNLTMGSKLCRQVGPDQNMSPVVYGRVYDNNAQAWMSTTGTITKIGTGTYEVEPHSGRVSLRGSALVTVAGQSPLVATATILSNAGDIIIEIYNPVTGLFTDADFSFIIFDPRNLNN